MTTWHEYLQQHGSLPPWPYPIRYGEEQIVRADVLVVGGGIAGCHAAINARRAGAPGAVMEDEAAGRGDPRPGDGHRAAERGRRGRARSRCCTR